MAARDELGESTIAEPPAVVSLIAVSTNPKHSEGFGSTSYSYSDRACHEHGEAVDHPGLSPSQYVLVIVSMFSLLHCKIVTARCVG